MPSPRRSQPLRGSIFRKLQFPYFWRQAGADPSFLLHPSDAKDLVECARDLQALVDLRTAALDQPLSGPDFDLSDFGAEVEPARDVSH